MPFLKPSNQDIFHILYVDDEPILLDLGKQYLEQKWNFMVTAALSAKDAVEHLENRCYDAIVSDYEMPGIDGIEFLHIIRAKYPDMPFILFTGKGREEVVIRALNAGADYYLQKGGDPKSQYAELAYKINQAIQKRETEKERILTEKAILESAETFQAIFEHSPYPIIITSCKDGTIKASNQIFQKKFGYYQKNISDKNPGEMGLFTSSDNDWFLNQCHCQGRTYDVPLILTRKNGNQVHTLISTTPITIKGYPALLTTLVDITQQKKIMDELLQKNNELNSAYEQLAAAEEELRNNFDELAHNERELRISEEKFRVLVENTFEGIILTDLKGVILYSNSSAVRMIDCTNSIAITGRNIVEFIAEESHDDIFQNYQNLFQTDSTHCGDFQVKSISGKGIFVKSMARIQSDGEIPAILISLRHLSEKKQLYEAVRASEMRFRAVSDNAGSWIWEIDRNGMYIYCSPAVEQILGYTPDEIVGRYHFHDLFDPAVEDDQKNEIKRAFGIRTPIKNDILLAMHKNGSPVVLNISATPNLDKNGLCIGYYGVSENITERKANESAFQKLVGALVRKTGLNSVRNVSEMLRSWLQADCVIVGRISGDQKRIHAISTILDGIELSETSFQFKDTPFEETLIQEFYLCTNHVSDSFPHADLLRNYHFRGYCGTTMHNSEGECIGVLCVMSRVSIHPPEGVREIMDIVAGKVAVEIERSDAEEALRQSEEKFRMLVENSLDGIVIIDMAGEIQFGNAALGNILDTDISSLFREESRNLLQIVTPEFKERVIEDIRHILEMEEPYTVYYEAFTATGREIWIEGIGKRVRYNSVPAIFLSLRDISSRKEMEDSLIRTNKQLKLLSSVTCHDILNKVMIIQGSLELIQMEDPDPGLNDYIRNMGEATDIIKSQIEFTRVYQSLGTHEAQWLSLERCMPYRYVPESITLSTHLQGMYIYADPMLEKIFFNLLDNSIRHGERVTRIMVDCRQAGEHLAIIWEDNGIGIPEEQRERIFELGFGKNTGFGMFLIREILSLTGITIKANGTVGKGARFILLVPKGSFRTKKEIETNQTGLNTFSGPYKIS